jgi:hypothetical protein
MQIRKLCKSKFKQTRINEICSLSLRRTLIIKGDALTDWLMHACCWIPSSQHMPFTNILWNVVIFSLNLIYDNMSPNIVWFKVPPKPDQPFTVVFGHNDTPFGRPTQGKPIGRPGVGHPQSVFYVFSYYQSAMLFLKMVCLPLFCLRPYRFPMIVKYEIGLFIFQIDPKH